MKCWKERSNEVLARTYSLYHQIMNTMIVKRRQEEFSIRKGWIAFWIQEVIYSWRGWRRSTLYPGLQRSWQAGYDTNRKRWKAKASAVKYIDVLSGNGTWTNINTTVLFRQWHWGPCRKKRNEVGKKYGTSCINDELMSCKTLFFG